MLLHNLQELDNHLRARTDEDLALASLLGVVDGFERIVEDRRLDHDCGDLRLSRRGCGVRYLHCHFVNLQEPCEQRVPSSACSTAGSSARSKQARRCHCGLSQ